MMLSRKPVTQYISITLSSLLLGILLVACGSTGSANSGSTPTPKTTTPTPSVAMQTYAGKNFKINYPQGWQQNASGNQVTFSDPISKNIMTITVTPNPGGASSVKLEADTTLKFFEKTLVKDGKDATIAPTATVGGDSWVQLSATGELSITDPGTQGTLVQLADDHPANSASSQLYEILYYGPTSTFTQASTMAFQPMLQSFTFVA